MKRAIAVLLVAAAALAAFVPFLACPDCHSAGTVSPAVPPGCPRCGDSGRISAFERVRRRPLDPDLALLVGEPKSDSFSIALGRLLRRSGRSIGMPDPWVGGAVFVAGGDRRVAARVGPAYRPAGPASDVALLFDEDGTLLDLVELVSDQGVLDLDARLEAGGILIVEAPAASRPHRFSIAREKERSVLTGGVLTLTPSERRFDVDAR